MRMPKSADARLFETNTRLRKGDSGMNRRYFLTTAVAMLALPPHALAATERATLYKDPYCGCCDAYAQYLRRNGFKIDVIETADFAKIGRDAGVPEKLEGCHAMIIDDYVVSGHVPVEAVQKLLRERPAIAGITLAGMPAGSPGMSGTKSETFSVYSFTKAGKEPAIFLTL
jgi:hypothetical protein